MARRYPICRETKGNPTRYGPRRARGIGALGPHLVVASLAIASPAAADELPDTGDLDGSYLFLGPVGAAVTIEEEWDGAFGGHAAWLRIRERRAIAAAGASLGGVRYSARDGGRVWLEGVVGTRRLGNVLIGLSAGPAIELAPTEHPRAGVTGAAWLFAGIVPYLRGGAFDEAGAFVEIGVAIALPIGRW